jgi:signal transduction histidine kinase
MQSPHSYINKGVQFVRDNPQLLYTLFLLIAIPVAFVVSSEQFLGVARAQNDKAEQARVGLMHDAFAAFLPTQFVPSLIDTQIAKIAAANQTITGFTVIEEIEGATSSSYTVIASLNKQDTPLGAYAPDPTTLALMRFALANPDQSLTLEFMKSAARQWKTARLIPHPAQGIARAYVVTDVSMSQSDAVLQGNIRSAYASLALIILLIIVLLARQARIVDYATLYKRLEEVDKMKDDFVSMAAHELRSPLTTIRGYADLLKAVQHLSPKGEELLGYIDRSALDLNVLITDILDVARLQEGRMSFKLERVPAMTEVRDVVEAFRQPAETKGLAISVLPATLPDIFVDKTRFHQVLVNLVGNAVKYTPKGSVTVSAKVLDGSKLCEFRVSDTGLGISAEAQQKLFSKFYRVKTKETEMITGTGLGLWITAEIVREMHGSIAVESIEGKGTDFIVRFPMASA